MIEKGPASMILLVVDHWTILKQLKLCKLNIWDSQLFHYPLHSTGNNEEGAPKKKERGPHIFAAIARLSSIWLHLLIGADWCCEMCRTRGIDLASSDLGSKKVSSEDVSCNLSTKLHHYDVTSDLSTNLPHYPTEYTDRKTFCKGARGNWHEKAVEKGKTKYFWTNEVKNMLSGEKKGEPTRVGLVSSKPSKSVASGHNMGRMNPKSIIQADTSYVVKSNPKFGSSRYPEQLHPTRSGGFLLGGILITYEFPKFLPVIILLLHSYWIPQIATNVFRDPRKPLHPCYIIGMSVTRLAILLYIFGCPRNFMHIKPYRTWVLYLVGFAGLQAKILLLQHYLRCRCFFLWQFFPIKYNYHKRSNPDINRASDCVICMTDIDFTQPPNACMVTPCDHWFHSECLREWMDIKMDCPTCRRQLPPV